LRILVVNPITTKMFEDMTREELKAVKLKPDTKVIVESISEGPPSIESMYEEYLAAPHVIRLIREGEEKGYDAAVINCFGDPGLAGAREVVEIPVVGPGQAAMLTASAISHRFSVVSVLKNVLPLIRELAQLYGVESKLASARSIDVPVLDLEKDVEKTRNALLEESKKALREDGAEAIVLGCTGFTGLASFIQERVNVPVIDPLPTAVKMAELLVDLNLSQSKIGYPKPPK
jgi:allantoin racemase